jgi:hypothetical protein
MTPPRQSVSTIQRHHVAEDRGAERMSQGIKPRDCIRDQPSVLRESAHPMNCADALNDPESHDAAEQGRRNKMQGEFFPNAS